jgi:Uma2 family endonuclease
MAALRIPLFTPEEYLAREREATFKSEYIAGEIFAMAGGSHEHNMICLDTAVSLAVRLAERGSGCDVHSSEQKVRIDNGGPFFYPDVSVVCGPPVFDDDDCLRNPALIVEVLSPSTRDYDRGEKFRCYRRLTSLRHYILIETERMHVEHYQQTNGVLWVTAGVYTHPDETISLPDMRIEVPLREIYRRIRFAGE